jgi:photosystem II stability/assembly factor-like uncharacterized protein
MKAFKLLLATVWILLWPADEIEAHWVQTNGPYAYGGNVTAFAISGTNVFAGTEVGGVFLSTNNGTSWARVNTGLTNTSVEALALLGMNLFAGTYNGGVFLSTNNGTSWAAVNTGLLNPFVTALAVSGTNLFAGTWFGVFLSTDNGTSWTAADTGLTYRNVYALAVSGSNLFAGTDDGVFVSTNNGTSWTHANTGLPTNTYVDAFAVSGTNLFAGTEWGVFLSTDNGTSWTRVSTGSSMNQVYALAVSLNGTGGANVFAGTRHGVFLTNNNGTLWTAVSTGLGDSYVDALAVNGANLFAGTYGHGVWRRPLSEMITSVREVTGNGLAEGYSLAQNYPNPFNPSTTIRFSLSKSGYVTLKVYDVLGREVGTLVDGVRAAGSYNVEWTPKNLASDVYLYRIQAGAFSDVKRLILLK